MDAAPLDTVADEFGITRRTLYRLIKQHHVQTYRKVGDRRTHIDRDDIRHLLGLRPKQSSANEPTTPPPTGDG